ncbi:HEAT repeat domain-containing protein [Planctomycetota bacterium]
MFKLKSVAVVLFIIICISGTAVPQTLKDDWNDFLHYTKIGRFDLAKGYAQAIIQSEPDPVALLELSQQSQTAFTLLKKVNETAPDAQLSELTGQILELINEGRLLRHSDPVIIAEEIRRLTSTARGKITAVKRLRDSGEYAIPLMLDAMADVLRKEELPNIIWALPQIGKDAIRPLVAALQSEDVAIKAEIIKALGEIGYPHSLPYLKYVQENDSSEQLRSMAKKSIERLDPAALNISAAQLFYTLAENYYYYAASLAPAEEADFGNIWFWDPDGRRLIRREVADDYFNELMAMRCCEWALKADAGFGRAIGLWIAAFFKAESADLEMPEYFGAGHAEAIVYAVTAGPEYLQQALARAVKDNNAYVALDAVEALATNAGEKSLFYRVGTTQPLIDTLTFDDKAVRYSAAIAIAAAGPKNSFDESRFVVRNLAQALEEQPGQSSQESMLWDDQSADEYAFRAAQVMFQLAQTQNPVIDLSAALETLINATNDTRAPIQIFTANILARLDNPEAQRAIAAMALSENNPLDIRLAAFQSLVISAKLNANMLSDETIDAVYSLVSSEDIEPELRGAAAGAFGALNLPSRKVKNLILDQAKS